MNIKPLTEDFKCPVRSTNGSGGYDIFMPTRGMVYGQSDHGLFVDLGFAAEVPKNHVALILPRSGKGSNHGLALNNTVGVIDSDYRGEWRVSMRLHNNERLMWEAGERLFQFIIVPVMTQDLMVVSELDDTQRSQGGFGSTGV